MLNDKHKQHMCGVCGRCHEDLPWGDDGNTPTFNICECCGVEFGYEDATPQGIERLREAWINNGAPWLNLSKRPHGWNLSAQLGQIVQSNKDR